jgi:transcriptional regulator with XRE-family HTH domain
MVCCTWGRDKKIQSTRFSWQSLFVLASPKESALLASCYFERVTSTLRRTLGANVRSLLAVRGMSQAGLASRIGKSQSTVSQIIHGRVPVAIDTIESLADALRVPHSTLLSRAPVTRTRRRASPEGELLAYWRAASPEVKSLVSELLQETSRNARSPDARSRAVNLVASLIELLH